MIMRASSSLHAGLALLLTSAGVGAGSPAIHEAIQAFIEDQTISGAVTLVARNGEITHHQAQGLADMEAGRILEPDDLFWIASMTKPITGVAVLMLQDEGKLSVDDTVSSHLPEFADLWLEQEESSERRVLTRPAREITLKDLLTHTSGVPNVDPPRRHSTLAELVALISQQPLSFEPGSRWSYSNAGIDTLGRILEVSSGIRFQEFLEERIFRPLGMRDTTFFPTRRQARRLAKAYKRDQATRRLMVTDVSVVKGDLWDTGRTVRPAGGLFSTADDLFRFYQMMLNGGVYRNQRLLSENAVRELTRTQTGALKTGFSDGMSWGLGFQVVKEPQGVTAMLSPGTFGHGGAYATQSWADPKFNTIYVLMLQRRGFPNGDQPPVRQAFQEAAAAAFAVDGR